MNLRQSSKLQYATNMLSRAEQNNQARGLKTAYREVREIVESIYQESIDVSVVLNVERMLNNGNANVLGNSAEAYDRMKELSEKAGFALKQYEIMRGSAKSYVAFADLSREGIGSSPGEPRVTYDGVPYDPVRSALTQFRKELLKELANRKVDKYPDNRQANMTRFKAAIKAERCYLEEYLSGRRAENEEAKRKHLENFDKRMEKLMRRIEPPQLGK